jgi:prevent-host-death family protein
VKVVPLTEAKAHLSQYARLCHDEPVIVTVNGVPSFQLVPLEEGDDLIDRLLDDHPKFRRTLEARLRERSVSAKEALKRL